MLDLSAIPVVDQHAHPVLRPEQVDAAGYAGAFSEAYDPTVVAGPARDTLFFRRSVREIAALLDCEPALDDVLAARVRLGHEALAARCFDATRCAALLLDDGYQVDRTLPLTWHGRFAPTYGLLRVERLAEDLAASAGTWAAFVDGFRAALDTPPPGIVGLKSIVAYRTGLAIEPPDDDAAAAGFRALRATAAAGERVRLAHKPLNDWVVLATLAAAARRGLPVQFHTGFGDPDLDLRLANPLHLRPLLESAAYRDAPVVLLHAGYPFCRETGYLAAMYPHVYVDFGLAVPFLSVAGMRGALGALLELAPPSRLLYSSDAHTVPELFYLGARWGRRALAAVLAGAVRDGDLTPSEADAAAEAILRGNALRLYGLTP